jgi:hypothetical protein
MCVQADQIQIMRYALIGLDGVALPDADKNAASVLWRPGARLDAA